LYLRIGFELIMFQIGVNSQ